MAVVLTLVVLLLVSACTPLVDETIEDVSQDIIKNEVEEESKPDVTFVLTGENFKFMMDGEDNPTLTVNEGDLVRIEFSSIDGFHDWTLDGFDVATKQVSTGDSSFIEFVASTVGEHSYYCSVGSHRENGLEGMIIVQ